MFPLFKSSKASAGVPVLARAVVLLTGPLFKERKLMPLMRHSACSSLQTVFPLFFCEGEKNLFQFQGWNACARLLVLAGGRNAARLKNRLYGRMLTFYEYFLV